MLHKYGVPALAIVGALVLAWWLYNAATGGPSSPPVTGQGS